MRAASPTVWPCAVSSMRSVRSTTSLAVLNSVFSSRSPMRRWRNGLPNMLKTMSGFPSSGPGTLWIWPVAIASSRNCPGVRGNPGSL